jgi:hypothetical protein
VYLGIRPEEFLPENSGQERDEPTHRPESC